jgi:hypothetical protein
MTIPVFDVPKIATSGPRTPDLVKAIIQQDAIYFASNPIKIPDTKKMHGIRGAVVKTMSEYQPDDTIRKIALAFIFIGPAARPISTSYVSDPGIMALHKWIKPAQVGTDWLPQINFMDEYRFLWNYAIALYVDENGDPTDELENEIKEWVLKEKCTCGGNVVLMMDEDIISHGVCDKCTNITVLPKENIEHFIQFNLVKVI